MPDPHPTYRFRVELNRQSVLWCSEVTGFDFSPSPVEARDDFAPPPVRRLPGRYKLGNISLKRGMTTSEEILAWARSIREGRMERKSFTITVLDEDGSETAVWQVNNAWPVKCSMSGSKGSETAEVLIETLEFAHEGIIRSR